MQVEALKCYWGDDAHWEGTAETLKADESMKYTGMSWIVDYLPVRAIFIERAVANVVEFEIA